MSTLIKKECVVKENKLPARYHLTDSGRALASKLVYGTTESVKSNETKESENETDEEVGPQVSKEPVIEPLHERDVNSGYNELIDQVPIDFDPPECIELNDSDQDDIIIEESTKRPSPTVIISSRSNSDADLLFDNALPDLNVFSEPPKITAGLKPSSTQSTKSLTKSASSQKLSKPISIEKEVASSSIPIKTVTPTQSTPSSMFKMRPDSFEIILFVDNCEQSHA